MWVKICGNTRLENCLLAAELGADAVGFVFAPGKRTVPADQVAVITRHLPAALETFGVFTSRDPAAIAAAVHTAGLTGVQLHSRYDPELLLALRRQLARDWQVSLVQVLHWHLDLPSDDQIENFRAAANRIDKDGFADALLIDSRTREASGGTGKTLDWAAASAALKGVRLPVVLAGGLRPGNVREAIEIFKPAGVDVSSGVETAPGVKNADEMRAFLANARL